MNNEGNLWSKTFNQSIFYDLVAEGFVGIINVKLFIHIESKNVSFESDEETK